VRSALSLRQQLAFGTPFVAGIIAVGALSGLGVVLGSGALFTSFVVSAALRRRVVKSREKVDRPARHTN
jgi:hypothetical protein